MILVLDIERRKLRDLYSMVPVVGLEPIIYQKYCKNF